MDRNVRGNGGGDDGTVDTGLSGSNEARSGEVQSANGRVEDRGGRF